MPRIFIVLVFAAAIVAVQTGYAHAGASPRAAEPDVIARWIGTRDVGTGAPDAVERWLAGHVEKTVARDGKATLPESQPISDTRNTLDLARNRRRDTAGPPISDVESSLLAARARSRDAAGAAPVPVSDNSNSLAMQRASATSAVRHLSPAGGGFAWGAAGIGGAAVFLLLAAAASGLSLAKRHRELAA
jgi:hypothetical protein